MFEVSSLKKLALGVVGAVLSVVMSASADITVNGERIGDSHTGGTGWTFDEFAYPKTLSLTGAGPFTLSGSDDHEIHIAVEADCAVTASNLSVAVSGRSGCAAFAISSDGFGHGNHSVALTLVGTNRFCSGDNAAGISVYINRIGIIKMETSFWNMGSLLWGITIFQYFLLYIFCE